MIIPYDMHVHSTFSIDAKDDLMVMCETGVEKGLHAICFTEHVDFHPDDEGFGYFQYEPFSQAIEIAREKFKGVLTILKGIEFGEPHHYPEEFHRLAHKEFDLIMGAVHRIGDQYVSAPKLRERLSREKIFEKYYEEVLRTVKFGRFDVLAHLDLPKRIMRTPFKRHALIDAILREAINSDILLELNTSPLRRDGTECSPDKVLLSQYIEKGGKRVTIGSDAHSAQFIGEDFGYVQQRLLRNTNLEVGIFRQRRFVKKRRKC